MNRRLRTLVRPVACGMLLAVTLQAESATIVAGSGVNPPTTATGIYEIAVATTDTGKVQKALALTHKGSLKEVHSRSSTAYQRREAGSTTIRVPTATYDKLLALAGGTNRDVNTMSLATRCQFYVLAGIPTTGMSCPTSTPAPSTTTPTGGTCPSGYEIKYVLVGGRKQLTCVLITLAPQLPETSEQFAWLESAAASFGHRVADWAQRLSPIPVAEARLIKLTFSSRLLYQDVTFAYLGAEAGGTDYGAWRFDGFGFGITWVNDGP
ncbi:MAG: hypothetical protein U1F14_16520 [Steroidobacteraceae bacterium]